MPPALQMASSPPASGLLSTYRRTYGALSNEEAASLAVASRAFSHSMRVGTLAPSALARVFGSPPLAPASAALAPPPAPVPPSLASALAQAPVPPSLASLGADSVSTAYGRLATLLDAEKRHGIKGTMVAHFFSPGSSGVSSAQGEWLAVRGPGKRAPHSWLPPLFCARPSADPPLAAPPPPASNRRRTLSTSGWTARRFRRRGRRTTLRAASASRSEGPPHARLKKRRPNSLHAWTLFRPPPASSSPCCPPAAASAAAVGLRCLASANLRRS